MHQIWFKTFYLVISNIAFLLPSLFALASNYYIQSAVYLTISFVSSLYHLCKEDWIDAAGDGGYCFILNFNQYHGYDMFFAQLTVPISFLYLVSFDAIYLKEKYKNTMILGNRKWLETLILYWFAFFNAFLVVSNNEYILTAAVLIISSGLTTALITMITYIKYKLVVKFYTVEILLGFFFTFFAMSFMMLQEHVSNDLYWFIHSSWHIIGSIGQFFLIISKKETHARRHYYNQSYDKNNSNEHPTNNNEYGSIKYCPNAEYNGGGGEYEFESFLTEISKDPCIHSCNINNQSDDNEVEMMHLSRLPYHSILYHKLQNLGELVDWL